MCVEIDVLTFTIHTLLDNENPLPCLTVTVVCRCGSVQNSFGMPKLPPTWSEQKSQYYHHQTVCVHSKAQVGSLEWKYWWEIVLA